jgi:hypothetical protein
MMSQYNITLSIFLFMVLFGGVVLARPRFMFHEDGSLREFGINSSQRTVLSGWVVAIFTALLSYIIVMYATRARVVA